ncbi:MAG: TonB-dependent receptor [Pyrinomonadaceae bacterium]
MRKMNRIAVFLTAILMAAVFTATAWSQAGTSSVTGLIADPQGNVVAGATVTLLGTQGTMRTAISSDNGVYAFPSVQTGTYRIEVEKSGFKKASVANVQALVDKSSEINVSLEIGQVTETVNVDAAGLESIVNTQDASLGNNFVSRQILQLPLQARNVADLLSLQPGVTPDGSVAGGRSDQANITLDGVDVNNQQNATAFTPVLRVNPDSVEEFRVTTANPDASKGRSSGAQISLITKSGTNDFHGALYEYHRNTVTAANEWFNNAAGNYGPNDAQVLSGQFKAGDERVRRPTLLRNLFGGRLGGPIVKDRLFFFYNYEGLREAKQESSAARTVPTASLAAGNIRFNDNTGQAWTITTAQINSFVLTGGAAAGPVVDVNPLVPALFSQAAAKYPCNDATVGDGRNSCGFKFNFSTPVSQDAHTARFDWNLTRDQRHQLSFRGNHQQDVTGALPYLPDTPPTNLWSHPIGIAATHNWLIKSNMTNRLSFGYTRIAFSNQGDSADPAISFRRIFQPNGFGRTISRTNPTTNITDDLTWIKGNHSLQFGTNIRLIKNSRTSFARAFDNGITNPSAYAQNVAATVINQFIRVQSGQNPLTGTRTIASSQNVATQDALVALLGRLNGYGANVNFDTEGELIAPNTGIKRIFETEEYDFYAQDTWKLRPNVTLTAGLRYGLSMPVRETQGYDVIPNVVLSDYLRSTIDAMAQGVNYREPISVRRAGEDTIYPLDKNNLQPRISIAWSPEFERGFMSKLFGKSSESVFRGGFSITNDYFGQQLATNWDGSNALGFSSTAAINVNTYNITTDPAPLYTGPGMDIRGLGRLVLPGSLSFPLTAPQSLPGNGKVETSLDSNLVSPINYSWNLSYGRRLPGNIWVDAAYVARLARNLLVGRDATMLRGEILDPRSGLTYNQAATILDRQLQAGLPGTQVAPVAFFENMWAPGTLRNFYGCPDGPGGVPIPNCTNTQAVYNGQPQAGDWTYLMQNLDSDTGSRYFFQGQYDALSAFSTVGTSDYHGATFSLRQRLPSVTWDLNYTFSKSLDEASGLQTGNLFGSAFVLNAFKLKDQRSVSDFDLTHVINFNGIWDLPIGRGRRFGDGMNKVLNALIGGWQLSGIYRYDSGYPYTGGFFDGTGWQTNWQIRSYNTQIGPIGSTGTHHGTATSGCTQAQQNSTSNQGCTLPNLFSDPDAAYAAFRTPHPGETGTRNAVRLPSYYNLDAGLAKSFNMPWKEGHSMTVRWDVFNVLNHPVFTGQATGLINYTGSSATNNFGRFVDTRTDARVMQFALRYDF